MTEKGIEMTPDQILNGLPDGEKNSWPYLEDQRNFK